MSAQIIGVFSGTTVLDLPLFDSRVRAGFPSPADDYLQRRIDLNQELVAHPAATFLVKVEGDSMKDAGILAGDTLVVDRSLTAKSGSVVLAIVNGEFTVKYFEKQGNAVFLKPANSAYPMIRVKPSDDFEVWGVVTNAIHHFKAFR